MVSFEELKAQTVMGHVVAGKQANPGSAKAQQVQQAQQQSPLGMSTYSAAGVPYPMGMSMQQVGHSLVLMIT